MGLRPKPKPKPAAKKRPKKRKPKAAKSASPPPAPAENEGPRTLQAILDRAWQQFHNADADIRFNGAVHMTEKGYRYANPAVNQRKEAATLIAKIQAQLDAEKPPKPAAGVVTRKR